ncbi:uncharacterized protein BT62DRAFT_518427 [Guyanagaster necrorhizus]|uniref:TECPR1-like DysF domain-containing protein n=1 Tax=Guyanagaster necrorhizus TaxID=856835 RepID=A0A9P7W0T6_9AGAR|nr:uncharacterized protein BT62DRAFT_518427 [Guyanagaster necrorhizus MCA 3950]KAG7450512.1 hypothetical protein BT62DRAFT_518427 [Guyanagaster necrorhizus MCA 3950]
MADPLPPPACLAMDDYHAVDAARKRFVKKSCFPIISSVPNLRHFFSSHKLRSREQAEEHEEQTDERQESQFEEPEDVASSAIDPDTQVEIGLPVFGVDADDTQTKFRWAVLYENQRGYTLFSLPFYSRRSLLPRDPYPFTAPSTSNKRSEQPNYSLTQYPLPDGNWQWVSKQWMVDMQSDSGQVQYDGFEYNWMFRKKHWTAEVGGFVRRRRWIRLMKRPAKTAKKNIEDDVDNGNTTAWSSRPEGSTLQSASVSSNLSDELLEGKADELWLKHDLHARWVEYCKLMKMAGRDAKKLELWKRWLALKDPNKIPVHEDISNLLAVYGDDIRNSFVYPDSRAQFMSMLRDAGMLESLFSNAGIQSAHSLVDFWSYEHGK